MPLIAPRWRLPYIALLTAVGLLLSVSALQAYRLSGGRHPWEPFLWEFSSISVIGLLVLAIHAMVGRLRGRPWRSQLAVHALALPLFSLAHVGGMFGLRLLVYAFVGVEYHPDALPVLLVYEGGKDAVSYLSFCLISRGVWAAQAVSLREQELQRAQRELAEARLARLADQVQPHFLFNTLNLISSVMYEDVARADQLLCQLADLLRQTLAAQQRVEHTLGEELALVSPFLALMQARFGAERLAVELDADDAARAVAIPALLLLAPVENAVKHHVARQRGLVTLSLQARCEAGLLRIEIINRSAAVAPTAALELAVDGRPASADADGGFGLRNLRERLATRYGDVARVALGPLQSGEQGMRLCMELPA